ncbi:hypothetical protein UPYG_G00349270 [Umbra pygmaea]|uniref:SWIM-type domain-containing protein n=1 Tax=Umbra pygmaea TaxID=75934 RepID=A0ABD0W287_UMBPY
MAANTGDSMELVQNPVIFSNVKAHTCLDHLKKEEQQRYATKLQVLGTCDPYSAPTALFTPLKSTTSLPELNFGDVYIYLVENPSPYTAIKMKAYKSTDSYLYFRSGWVNNPVVWEVKDNTFFIVKAKVNHSYSLNDPPLTAWVAVEKDGLVRFGHCTCMAGLGEVCSHVGAILYALLAAVNKLSSTACTDKACSWNEPSKAAIRRVEYAEGSQIAFTKAQRKRSADGYGDLPHVKIPPPTPDECTAFYNMLYASEGNEKEPVKSSILSVVPGHAQRYIPQSVQLNIPASLNKLYKPQFRSLSPQELQAESEKVFAALKITEEQCSVIENETRLQSKCAMWFDQRAGRVTASNIRTACQTDPDQPAVSLLKKLCYPVAYKHQTNNLPQSLKWGIQHEDMVVEEYDTYRWDIQHADMMGYST